MPKTKMFSTEKALSMAMHQFWTGGFCDTSIQDLVDHMGIGRGSIYDTFESKRALYLRALCFYVDSHLQRFRALLARTSPRGAILNVFDGSMIYERTRDGCFLVNASVDRAPHDAEVAQVVSDAFRELVQIFRRLIDCAQATREIPITVDTGFTAQCLLNSYIALCVLVRSGADRTTLREIGRQAEALLNRTQPR